MTRLLEVSRDTGVPQLYFSLPPEPETFEPTSTREDPPPKLAWYLMEVMAAEAGSQCATTKAVDPKVEDETGERIYLSVSYGDGRGQRKYPIPRDVQVEIEEMIRGGRVYRQTFWDAQVTVPDRPVTRRADIGSD